MAEAFAGGRRALADSGVGCVVFAHKTTEGWEALLSGLVGGFEPFPLTRAQREQSGDARVSIEERYAGRADYLQQVQKAAGDLVRRRFMRTEDVPAVMLRAGEIWDAVVNRGVR